jgi:hypothetical protein
MRRATHPPHRLLAAAVVLAVAFAGCGSDDKSDTSNAKSGLERRIATMEKRAKRAPSDPKPYAELAKLHFQSATLKRDGQGYSDEGKAELRKAASSWERYLSLDPKRVDTDVAQLISAAYGPGLLDDPKRAVAVQQVLVENTSPPRAGAYVQLAQMAYSAGERDVGDRAAKRAVELSKPARQKKLRARLKAARTQLAP